MLKITIPGAELFDEDTGEFISTKETSLTLEHSLVSVSKWESKWEHPFIGRKLTTEESIDYIQCMTLTQNVDPLIYKNIPAEIIQNVVDYIDSKQTATWFGKDKNKSSNRKAVTSEVIYYWMILCGIPFECQKWHLNRLLTLIRVCQEESKPNKKMTAQERYALNMARRKKFNTKG